MAAHPLDDELLGVEVLAEFRVAAVVVQQLLAITETGLISRFLRQVEHVLVTAIAHHDAVVGVENGTKMLPSMLSMASAR